jgi:membrane protein
MIRPSLHEAGRFQARFRSRQAVAAASMCNESCTLPRRKAEKCSTLASERMTDYLGKFRKAILLAFGHDVINTAKAAAYSGMLMLFPALLVLTTLLAQVQEGTTLVGAIRSIFEQFLPADTMDLLQSYVLTRRLYSGQLILSATFLSIFAGLGMMLSLMEGFRRAYNLPPEAWGFGGRRLRALLLVPIALVPLSVATMVIVFGHQIELWMIENAGHELRHIVLFSWRMVRWSISLFTSITVLAALYHFGTKRKEHWLWVAPGAVAGTLLWFPATLAFGWYVTRIADYSMFYGSFGAGIATLVWLYITAFSVLIGAELNGVLYGDRQEQKTIAHISVDREADSPPEADSTVLDQ